MWIGLLLFRYVLALEVVSELGDISLFPNQTLSIDVDSIFQGTFLEYEAKGTNIQTTLIPRTQFEQVFTAPLEGKIRKVGPAFKYASRDYLTLYTSEALELWLFYEDLYVKIWEGNIEQIQGIDLLDKTARPGLVCWTHAFDFYYLNCEAAIHASNVTLQLISNMTIFPVMKVAICSESNKILIAGGDTQIMYILKYLFDEVSVTVSAPITNIKWNPLNSSIIDLICTDDLILLTTDRIYSNQIEVFPDDLDFKALWKINSHNWAALGDQVIIFFRESFSEYWMPSLTLAALSTQTNAISAVAFKNSTYWIIHSFDFQEFELTRIPMARDSEHCEFDLMHDFNSFRFLLLIVCQSEITVYSVTFSPATLLLNSKGTPATLDLCAYDYLDKEQVCTHSPVHTIDFSPSVLAMDSYNLTSVLQKRLSLLTNSKEHLYEFGIFYWFSGSNLEYSLQVSDLPAYLTVASSISNFNFDEAVEFEIPVRAESTIKCLYIDNLYAIGVFIRGREIEIHERAYNAQYSIPDPLFNVSSCIVTQRTLMMLGSRGLIPGQIEVFNLDWPQFTPLSAESFKGMVSAGDTVLCYTDSSIFELQVESLQLSLRWTLKYEIIDVWMDQRYIWVLSEEKVERFSIHYTNLMVIDVHPASRVVGVEDKVICYHSDLISVYSITNSQQINTVHLNEDCELSSMQVWANMLFVKCREYIQLISLDLREHGMKIMIISSTASSLIQFNLHLKCNHNLCTGIRYQYLKWPIMTLKIGITDTLLYGKAATFTSLISVRSDNESREIQLITEVKNSNFITVNPAWKNFTYELPWTHTLYIPLSQLFIGQNLSISLQTSSDLQYELFPRYEVTNLLRLRLSDTSIFDICADSNVIAYIEAEYLVFEQYKCLKYWCRSFPNRVLLTEFGFQSLIVLEIFTCQDSNFLLYFRGFSLNDGHCVEQFLNYNIGSHQQLVLFERWERNTIPSFHLIRESSSTLHIFQLSSALIHYIFSTDSNYTLIYRAVVRMEESLFSASMESVFINDEWKVFILTSLHSLLECVLRHKLIYLRSIHTQQAISSDLIIIKATSDYIVLRKGSTLLWYSLSQFTQIRSLDLSVVMDLSRASILPAKIQSNSGLLALHVKQLKCIIMIDIAASISAEVVTIFPFDYFKFSGTYEGIGYNFQESAFSFVHFGESLLVLSGNESRVDSAHFQFRLLAQNSDCNISSPVFTVSRSHDGLRSPRYEWLWILLCVCALITSLAIWKWKVRPLRGERVEEVEIISIDSSRSKSS